MGGRQTDRVKDWGWRRGDSRKTRDAERRISKKRKRYEAEQWRDEGRDIR